MKTSKKLIVMLLALILGITALIPATFSWYDHNGNLTGNKMGYSKSNIPVSAGTISAETKKFYMDSEHPQGGGDVNKVYYDQKGNKEYNGGAITSGIVNKESTQYYGTTFTNTGSSPAYVNLYLKNFTNDPNNYIGTLQPNLTYKNLSSSVHLANKNQIRVYFQWDKAVNAWNASGARTYVVCKDSAGNISVTQFDTTNNKLENKTELSNITTYYADLADNTVSFYFATDAGVTSNIDTTTGEVTQAWYRTKGITNVQAETGYYLTGAADDTTFNAQYNTFTVSGGISVKTYFDTATINKNQHAYVTLNEGTNYTGATATYTISGSNIGINENTGYITATGNFGNGSTATVTTTITGSLGDTTTVATEISNPSLMAAAPVTLNVEVPAGHEDEDGNWVDGKAEIVWYIQNKSAAACQFASIYYTK